MRRLILLTLAKWAQPGNAQDIRMAVFGQWGNAAQCAGTPIVAGGSVAHAAIEIGPDWLSQRGIWCRLTWFDPVVRLDGLYVKTRAQCGEDASRSYWLAFDLTTTGDAPHLTLIWDEILQNRPMHRCVQR